MTEKKTILVVEDEEMTRNLVIEILAEHDYKILEAPSGEAALNLSDAFDKEIDLLLTDVIMPKMNGKELYGQLTMSRPALKVLYMSGYTDNMITLYGIMEKGIHCIHKPFSVHKLVRKVKDVLDS